MKWMPPARKSLSCAPISIYALPEMDRPCSGGAVDCFLFYSLGHYCLQTDHRKRGGIGRYQFWQARLYQPGHGGLIYSADADSPGMGQAAEPGCGGRQPGLDGPQLFRSRHLFGWRMPGTANRFVPAGTGDAVDAGIGLIPGYGSKANLFGKIVFHRHLYSLAISPFPLIFIALQTLLTRFRKRAFYCSCFDNINRC